MSQRPKKPVSSTVAPLLSHIYSQLAAEKAVLHTSFHSTSPCLLWVRQLLTVPEALAHTPSYSRRGSGGWLMRSGRSLALWALPMQLVFYPPHLVARIYLPHVTSWTHVWHQQHTCLISTAHIISRIHTPGVISWTCRSRYFLDTYVSHHLPDHVQHCLSDLQVTHHFQDPTSAVISWIHRSHVTSWIRICRSRITMSHAVSQIITSHIISWILTCPLISCIHTSHVLLQGVGLHLQPIRRHLVLQSSRCCVFIKE